MDPKFLEELQKLKEQKNADLDNIDLGQLSIPDFDDVEDPQDPMGAEAEEEISGGTIKFERVSEQSSEDATPPTGGRRGRKKEKIELDEETRKQRAKIRNCVLISTASVVAVVAILFTTVFGIRNANMKKHTYPYWGMGLSIENGVEDYSFFGHLKTITKYAASGKVEAIAEFHKGNCVKETLFTAEGSINVYYAHEYVENTRILSSCYEDGQMTQSVKYTVLEDGTIQAEATYYAEDSSTEISLLTLDEKGNVRTAQYLENGVLLYQKTYTGTLVTEETHYDEAKNVKSRVVYEYNGAKQLLTQTLYDAKNAIQGRTVNQYNEKNLLTKTIEYDGSGAILQYKTFNYDLNNNPIKEVTYSGDGTLKSQVLKVFNNKNQVVKETNLNTDGSILYCYGYEYDKQGYVAKSIVYRTENSSSIDCYTVFTRNEDGNVTKSEIYNAGSVLIEKTSFNEAGFVTEYYKFNDAGTLILEEKSKYDEKQRLIQKSVASFDDKGAKIDYFCEEYDENDLITMQIREIVAEELYEQLLFSYTEDGRKKQETMFDKSGKTVYDRTFDEEGRVQTEYVYEDGKEIAYNEYTYDENDRIIQKRTLDSSTKVMIKTAYTYDENGVLIESLDSDILNKPIVGKHYDDAGLVTTQTNYKDGALSGRYEFQYDEQGRVIVREDYDETEKFIGKIVYYYRNDGGYDYTVYDEFGVAVEDSRGEEYLPENDKDSDTDSEANTDTTVDNTDSSGTDVDETVEPSDTETSDSEASVTPEPPTDTDSEETTERTDTDSDTDSDSDTETSDTASNTAEDSEKATDSSVTDSEASEPSETDHTTDSESSDTASENE